MSNKTEKKFILANRTSEGDYSPSEMESSWEKLYEGFEYGDVYEGEYQLWEKYLKSNQTEKLMRKIIIQFPTLPKEPFGFQNLHC
jgi:hypothetical protein